MRSPLFLFLFFVLSSFSYGQESSLVNDFRFYDPGLNVLYLSVNSELMAVVNKKPKKIEVTNNIAVYDIAKDSIRYVFKKGLEEQISEVIFEESFDPGSNSIRLNVGNADEEDNASYCVNNFGLSQRELSPKLIIETVSVHSGMSTLWMCNKNGSGLEMIDSLKAGESYFFDTRGRNILIIKKSDAQAEVKKIKY